MNPAAPPFYGTKVLDQIPLAAVEPLLDRDALFASRWQFRQGQDAAVWEALKREKAEPLLARLLAASAARGIITPKLLYGHFACRQLNNGIIITEGEQQLRIDFPRERAAPNRCVADLFGAGFVTIQLATVGKGSIDAAAAEHAKGRYSEAFFLKGLAAQFAEATAEYGHRLILEELGIPEGQGARFSPGYPAFPDLLAQRKLMRLLAPMRIGVSLTETCHLVPEYSTSAIISIDPKATHFRP